MATRIFATYMLQILHMEDSGSILHQDAFNVFKVGLGLTITAIESELRDMINFYYGFIWSRVQGLFQPPADPPADPNGQQLEPPPQPLEELVDESAWQPVIPEGDSNNDSDDIR